MCRKLHSPLDSWCQLRNYSFMVLMKDLKETLFNRPKSIFSFRIVIKVLRPLPDKTGKFIYAQWVAWLCDGQH